MKISEVLLAGRKKLIKNNIETPGLVSGVLLSDVLSCDKSYLISHGDDEISQENISIFQEYINRASDNEPISYILGEKEFMGLPFKVGKNVLIPRPETELLVEEAIKLVIDIYDFEKKPVFNILDLCTGSGCIAISVAKFLVDKGVNVNVLGLDFSKKALEYAEANSSLNDVQNYVRFIKEDLLHLTNHSNLDWVPDDNFDLVLSNPPYIVSSDISVLDNTVKDFEPLSALDGGNDGLTFYRKICSLAPLFLKNNRALIFEVGINQSNDVKNIMINMFHTVNVYKDLSDIDRVVAGMLYCK